MFWCSWAFSRQPDNILPLLFTEFNSRNRHPTPRHMHIQRNRCRRRRRSSRQRFNEACPRRDPGWLLCCCLPPRPRCVARNHIQTGSTSASNWGRYRSPAVRLPKQAQKQPQPQATLLKRRWGRMLRCSPCTQPSRGCRAATGSAHPARGSWRSCCRPAAGREQPPPPPPQ